MAYQRTLLHPTTPDIVKRFNQSLLGGPSPTTINNALNCEFRDRDWRFVGARAPISEPVVGFSVGGASPPMLLLYLNGAHPNLPDRKLAKYLANPGISAAPSLQVRQRVYFIKSIHAWNAWRTGKTTNLKYSATSGVPTVL
jgi:hypothetical protein